MGCGAKHNTPEKMQGRARPGIRLTQKGYDLLEDLRDAGEIE